MCSSDLYLGPDHILLVEMSMFSETYRRCFFKDIQAMSFRPTVNGYIGTALLLLPPIGIALAAWLNRGDGNTPVFLVFLFFVSLPSIVNGVLGPTCAFQIQTAVQTLRVPSLRRIRTARRFIARMRPLIEQSQLLNAPAPSALEPPSVEGAQAVPAARSLEP